MKSAAMVVFPGTLLPSNTFIRLFTVVMHRDSTFVSIEEISGFFDSVL